MASHKTVLALSAVALIVLLLAGPGLAYADDPTPTPTATTWPMPTRQYQNLRPTPSPWIITPTGPDLNIDADTKAGELVDNLINGYRFINFGATEDHGGVVDLIIFFAMSFLILQALMALISDGGD
jgi:hypothetical protein